jgi:hypothetical protein
MTYCANITTCTATGWTLHDRSERGRGSRLFVTIHEAWEHPPLEEVVRDLEGRNLPYFIDKATIARNWHGRPRQPFRAAFAKDQEFGSRSTRSQRVATLTLKQGTAAGRSPWWTPARLNEMGIVFGVDLDQVCLALSEKPMTDPS